MADNDDNFAVIDLKSGRTKRMVTGKDYLRHRLKGIEYLHATKQVAVSEAWQDNVLIANAETAKIEEIIRIPTGAPNAMATFGRCLIVASEFGASDSDTPYIYFYDVTQKPAKLVETWDTSKVGPILRTIRKIAVNPGNGVVYARSSMLPLAKFEENALVALYDEKQTALNYCYRGW